MNDDRPSDWQLAQLLGELIAQVRTNRTEIQESRQAILVTLEDKHAQNVESIKDTNSKVHEINHSLNNAKQSIASLDGDMRNVKLQIVEMRAPIENVKRFRYAVVGAMLVVQAFISAAGVILTHIPFIHGLIIALGGSQTFGSK